jgi:hypothetical protein
VARIFVRHLVPTQLCPSVASNLQLTSDASWCILVDDDYMAMMREAGFVKVQAKTVVLFDVCVTIPSFCAAGLKEDAEQMTRVDLVKNSIVSATVVAYKDRSKSKLLNVTM